MRALTILLLAAAPSWGAGEVSVRLDAAEELEAVVWRLSLDKATLADTDSDYARAAEKRFAPFAKHAAAAFYRKRLSPRPNELEQAVARLSPPPSLAERIPFVNAWKGYFGGLEGYEEWRSRLGDFARESRFEEFLKESAPSLGAELAGLQERVRRLRLADSFERYAGLPFEGRLSVLAAPLRRPGLGGGVVSRLADGTCEVATFVGPRLHAMRLEFDDPRLATALWHEMGHCVLDGLADLLAAGEARPENSRDLREHVAEAVALRLTLGGPGVAAYASALADQSTTDAAVLQALIAALEEYEAARARYPTLAHFYPRLRDAAGAGPGPEAGRAAAGWLDEQSAGFPGRGQNLQALSLLELRLSREFDKNAAARRAALRLREGRLKDAEADARRILAGGEDARARLVLGVAALRAGRLAEGRKELEAALGACSGGVCQDARAWLAAASGRSLEPANPALPARKAHVEKGASPLEKGMAHYVTGDYERAEKELKPALTGVESWEARISLGAVWEAAGRGEKADKQYGLLAEEARGSDGPSAHERLAAALYYRGSLRARGGRLAEAEADLSEALEKASGWVLRPRAEDELARLRLRRSFKP